MSGGTLSRLHHEAGDLFFTNAQGEEVYLAGTHTWPNVQDYASEAFDFGAFLDLQQSIGASSMRLWAFDGPHRDDGDDMAIMPWVRAADGRFDVTRVNPDYLQRLVQRVDEAGDAGLYVSVMIGQGWTVHHTVAWEQHPFKAGNNVNGIASSPEEVQSLHNPDVVRAYETLARAVVEAVGARTNVMWEVGNEFDNTPEAMDFQNHMVRVIRDADPYDRPAGITAPNWWSGDQGVIPGDLAASEADWTSPDGFDDAGGYMSSPPGADGDKVSIVDVDHLWGTGGGDAWWVWSTFARGHNVWVMDDLDGMGIAGSRAAWPDKSGDEASMREGIRQTRAAAEGMDLTDLRERGELSDSGYALANPGTGNYVAYDPDGGGLTLDLSGSAGLTLRATWTDVGTGRTVDGGILAGGNRAQVFDAPFGGASALVLTATADAPGGGGGGDGGGGTTPPGDDFTPVQLAAGAGPDTLVLHVSQEAFRGSAVYTVAVDGVQVGGAFTASALHASGQHDTLTLKGAWGAGEHEVTVELTNDLWEPGVGDRNIFVAHAEYNGTPDEALGEGWMGGSFTVSGPAGGGTPPGTGGGGDAWPAPTGPGQLLAGADGAETLTGGPGGDVLVGGAGDDRLAGRAGADVFGFAAGDGQDQVMGFSPGTDALLFRGVDAAGLRTEAAERDGEAGLAVHYGDQGDLVFLAGVAALAEGDLLFA